MKNWKKVILSGIPGILAFTSLYAGISDTLVLEKVIARGVRFGTITTGAKYYKIDSFTLKIYQSASLADLLQQQSLIALKTHGPGGLATISLRGGSSRHTAIIWNGLSLRNPMSGEMNFSALPVGFIDEISIQPGGSSTMYGSGAASGVIFLGNKLYLNNAGFSTTVHSEIASFGGHNGILSSAYQCKKFATQLKVGYQTSDNDFRFTNLDKFNDPVDTLKHASFSRYSAILQQVLKIGKGELQSDIWFVRYFKNIPALTSDYEESSAFQQDENLRIAINYSNYWDKLLIHFRSGYLFDRIFYHDDAEPPVETNNFCMTFINEAEAKYSINLNHTIYTGVNYTIENASSQSYISDTSRQRFAVFGRYNLSVLHDKLNFSIETREERVGKDFSPVVFSLGNKFAILPRLCIQGIIARHFALPIMDDLFWSDAYAYGNPQLKPEYGWNYEAGAEYEILGSVLTFKNEISFYYHHVSDLILWQAVGENGKYTPVNVNESKSKGFEFMGESKFKIPEGSVRIQYMYSYTNARISEGFIISGSRPRPFVPRHNASVSAAISFKDYNLQYIHSFIGRSFLDEVHTLDGYSLGTLYAGYSFNCKFFCIDTYLKIRNIFNVTYKVMPGYAQAPRNYALGINLKF